MLRRALSKPVLSLSKGGERYRALIFDAGPRSWFDRAPLSLVEGLTTNGGEFPTIPSFPA